MTSEEGEVKRALELCEMVQSMIDISAGHLEGLRTQCATSVEITQKEIRTIEGKLIKQFSRQLVAKSKVPTAEELKQYPKLKQWLQVVGLSKNAIATLASWIHTMEALLESNEKDTKSVLQKCGCRDEEIRRLISAMRILKNYTERQLQGEKSINTNDIDLHWDSWDRSPKLPPRTRQSCTSVPMEDILRSPPPNSHSSAPQTPQTPIEFSPNTIGRDKRHTPPATPVNKKKEKLKFPTTPPPHKKNQTRLNPPEQFPLTKSKSHESQLGNRVEQLDPAFSLSPKTPNQLLVGRSVENLPTRKRLATEPTLESENIFGYSHSGHSSPVISSPVRSPPYTTIENVEDLSSRSNTLTVPKSPKTPTHGSMGHFIQHRFTKTIKMTTCSYCDKQMIIGFKCKECKYKCHRDCSTKAPPSCGLPNEFVDMFAQTLRNEGSLSHSNISRSHNSPIVKNDHLWKNHSTSGSVSAFHGHDSSSNTSSCNSSTPSSPALIISLHTPPSPTINQSHEFFFPDVIHPDIGITIETRPIDEKSEMVATHQSNDSDKTVSGSGTSGSTDSEKTLPGRIDSQDSQVSDVDPQERSWPRQNSLSLREWDIPYDELSIGEIIGTGRFGTVFKGNWHGDVAIKVLNMDHVENENQLEAFKQEVATFRKTRHENLVLFMGACMKPLHLAIITSLCKGKTLYTHIHSNKDKLALNKAILIATQISQGMGYLHARGIVHKDLKSKNIFLENGKVIITDFGLFSVTKLCCGNRKGDWLSIPPGWLCYLAPEIVRNLQAGSHAHGDELPFTMATDVYAFGTVWYELLCGEWPFKDQPPEAIIWQVGRGVKQSLSQIQASRDVKEILMVCWSYKSEERPEFSQLLKSLERLPKKRLARSPSHPIHLSRSAESVF